MKQKDLARAAGISEGHLSMVLSGKRKPSAEVMRRLAEVTGTPVSWWADGDMRKIRAWMRWAW